MASRRPSTRANPKGPPATPGSDPEEILRRARALLRQTSSATQEATSGISRNFSAIIYFAEALNSQEFINTSENPSVWASSSNAACEDPIPGDSTGISIPPSPSQKVPSSVFPSSTLSIPIFEMDAPQLTKMERILVARYDPLNLPNPLFAMPTVDYLKYMPKLTGERDFIAEEHLEAFYIYAENINREQEDVWTRVFVQILDGQARKWFK